jgi:hypothetical protein
VNHSYSGLKDVTSVATNKIFRSASPKICTSHFDSSFPQHLHTNAMSILPSSPLRCCLTLLFVVWNVSVAFTVNPKSQSCASDLHSTSQPAESSSTMASKIPMWFQHEITITAPSRGCHLITGEVQKAISSDISQIKIGEY